MEEYIEVTGKDLDEAVMNAAMKLETPSYNVKYEVIEAGSAGFLGMFSKPAKIKARKKTEEEVIAEQKAKEEEEAKAKAEAEAKVKEETEKTVKASAKAMVVENEAVVAEEKPKKEISEAQVKEVSEKFLKDVFKAMEMEVNIDITLNKEEECVYVELSGDEMGLLIGKRGQTLDALQCILKNVINKEIGGHLRVKMDTENYRKRREDTLVSLANNIASKVKRTRTSVELEAMRSYERRIIHSTLQDNKYVETKSEGEEPYRHVVVYPKKNAYYDSGNYRNKRYNKSYNKSGKGYSRNYNKQTTSESAPALDTENNE
ncbi:MAG: RNA-binding cell elongation regulator Jag/EloR [Oscillospiraceae bacterium]|nr:RNA-binding cell elongation regulator Jag/EloR [Oscillospiraceae bacterium]